MRIAMPHEFVAGGRISGTTDVASEASYEADGIAELGWLGNSFFLA